MSGSPLGPAPRPASLFLSTDSNVPLDLEDVKDRKLYTNAIKGIETKYDLSPQKLKSFLDDVHDRSQLYGWGTIMSVPDKDDIKRDIIQEYGRITIEECNNYAKEYFKVRQRKAQNSVMLYNFLVNSLTTEAKAELSVQQEKYVVDNIKDGLSFLKHLISKAQIDTVATVNVLRTSIARLPTKMVEYAGNIKDFNLYVRQITNAIAAYGEKCPELLVNVFNAYETVEDEKFQAYIMTKKNSWEDGTTTVDVLKLMSQAENHYKMRVEGGTWKAITKKDERIVALEAQIEALTTKTSSNNTGGGSTKLTSEQKAIKYAWKKVPPKDGQTQKTFEGRIYFWCTKHKAWTMHRDEDCEGVGVRMNNRNNTISSQLNTNESNAVQTNNQAPRVTVDNALKALIRDGGAMFE
jgi:hypothetical protein